MVNSVEKAIHSLMLNAEETEEIYSHFHALYDSVAVPDNPFEWMDLMAERDSLIGAAKADSVTLRFQRVAEMVDTFDVVHPTEYNWLEAYAHYSNTAGTMSWTISDSLKTTLGRMIGQSEMQSGASIFLVRMMLGIVEFSLPTTPSLKLAFEEDTTRVSDGLSVYPNPSKDKVFFELKGEIELPAQLSIFNITGHLVHQLNITDKTQSIDVSNWSGGIYLYRLSNEEKGVSMQGKFVIIKE